MDSAPALARYNEATEVVAARQQYKPDEYIYNEIPYIFWYINFWVANLPRVAISRVIAHLQWPDMALALMLCPAWLVYGSKSMWTAILRYNKARLCGGPQLRGRWDCRSAA